jgi:ABC-2 type transport system ATP-binding protein
MKQRLAIASALLGAPELVILDEPTNGLDPEGIREIRDLIHRLRDQGRTIFVSSHLLNEIERTCTHVAVLKKGRILQSGSLVELMSPHPVALVRAPDVIALHSLLAGYPGAISVSLSDGGVLVELHETDTATLNRWLAERNVFASHLALKKQTLEEVFMDLTSEPAVAA